MAVPYISVPSIHSEVRTAGCQGADQRMPGGGSTLPTCITLNTQQYTTSVPQYYIHLLRPMQSERAVSCDEYGQCGVGEEP
jgi:hypothetical protein